MYENNNIVVVGMGYVGLSLALILAKKNKVIVVDVDANKVDLLNQFKSPINDREIETYIENNSLDLFAVVDGREYYKKADYIIIAVPTDYDDVQKRFDCMAVESVVESIISQKSEAVIVIKSTIPVGYSDEIIEKYPDIKLLFCPEFLRESKALYDNLFPTRIVIGCSDYLKPNADDFAKMLITCGEKENVEVVYSSYMEAESIKLFANTYLAMRISFFNELDTYAEVKGLNTEKIIKGICLDPRIGNYYNNPSFGYGGYCLPKDTKQMLANYDIIPQKMMSAIVESNKIRKEHIAKRIFDLVNENNSEKTIGVYRLIMKTDADNIRQSSIIDVLLLLKQMGANIIIYEPLIEDDFFEKIAVEKNLTLFKKKTNLIIANRYDVVLDDVKEKVYTRDIFKID